VRSREDLQRGCDLIAEMLQDGAWHSSNEIHRALQKEIPDGMFGRAKKELGIAHRPVAPPGTLSPWQKSPQTVQPIQRWRHRIP